MCVFMYQYGISTPMIKEKNPPHDVIIHARRTGESIFISNNELKDVIF